MLKLQKKIKMRVGAFQFHAMMARARGDEHIDGGRGLAGSAGAVRKLTRLPPDWGRYCQLWQDELVSRERPAIGVVPRSIPKLKPYRSAPSGLPYVQQAFHSTPDMGVPLRAQLMHPA